MPGGIWAFFEGCGRGSASRGTFRAVVEEAREPRENRERSFPRLPSAPMLLRLKIGKLVALK